MKVKAILDNEIIDWVEVKKGKITEVDDLLWDYLLRAYKDRREKVEDDEKDEEVEETRKSWRRRKRWRRRNSRKENN